jgi:hypothetical protein
MSIDVVPDRIAEAAASIEEVASHIEGGFANVGNHLGRGHAIFQELHGGLASLSQELSGTKIEGASAALQDISSRLNGLAEALLSENALLGSIGESTAQASSLLAPLIKQIQMISIIARSARIEAASLEGDRENFLDFTQEAFDLAKSIQLTMDGCVRDQQLLSAAIKTALERQKDFEDRYRLKLLSAGTELNSAYSGMRSQQNKSVHLLEIASASSKRITEAVGSSIVSLQAGDSTRQRLQHICRGLHIAAGSGAGIVPALAESAGGGAASLVCDLQAMQLRDTASGFNADIGQIARSLTILRADAAGIVEHGRSLYGNQGDDKSSFLDVTKQALAQASALIRTCDEAGRSVDDALSAVEDTLGKFRQAILGLSETVVDIILIGMNAGLKASHLGAKGRAFVVIANELKTTANQISTGAKLLKPVLDSIERAANELKGLRVDGDPSQLSKLEPSILHAVEEIEAGNSRLAEWMNRLVHESAQFEGIMTAAQALLTTLGEASATLPGVATRLESDAQVFDARVVGSPPSDNADGIGPVLDDLYAQYTMVSERDVHLRFLNNRGLAHAPAPAASQLNQDSSDDVLFF